MTRFLALTLSGAITGGVYAILAAGLVLTYSTTRVFNFAHGAVAFSTAYLFFQLQTGQGWPVWLAAMVCILVFAPLLGLLLDRILFRSLVNAEDSTKTIATIGLMLALPALTIWLVERAESIFGWSVEATENVVGAPGLGPSPPTTWLPIQGVPVDSDQVIVVVAAILMSLGLFVLLRFTRLGLALRADADRPDLASLRGIDHNRTSAVSWVLSFGLAGLAGVVLAPLFGLSPIAYTFVLLIAATAAVIGGLRSIPLAIVGALAIGILQNLIVGYANLLPDLLQVPGLRTAGPFLLLLLALLWLGRSKARPAGTAATDAAPPLSVLSPTVGMAIWVALGVGLALWILFAADGRQTTITLRGLALGIVFLSFTVVTGIGGMVSLAQAAFVTMGALSTGALLAAGVPFPLAIVLGVVAATVAGLITALPAMRLAGLYLALSTLALGFLADGLVFQFDFITNDQRGWDIPRINLGIADLADNGTFAITLLLILGLLSLGVRALYRTRAGRAMLAVRSTEVAAASSGISPTRTKLAIFALSAAIAGFGGILLASVNRDIAPLESPVLVGLVWLAVTVTFGVRRPGAAIVGALFFVWIPVLLENVTDSEQVPLILFGLGAINLARYPDGILSLPVVIREQRRARRRPEPETEEITEEGTPGEEAIVSILDRHDSEPLPAAVERALAMSGIHASYGDVEVLHGVDVEVPRAQVVALLGANGAGKSTLCAIAAGTLAPTVGAVDFDGEDVTDIRAPKRAKAGLMLLPEGRGIFPSLSVDDNLSVWLPDAAERDAAYERFPRLGERRKQPAGSLSGGEQQMLVLASALANPPKVLIADEPSLGLAPIITRESFEAFSDLRAQGTSLLLVEEKATEVLGIADRVVFMERGRIVWEGPASAVDGDRLTAAYLGEAG